MIYEGKQKIWSEYQKEIPDNGWFYVRSCIRQSFFQIPARFKLIPVKQGRHFVIQLVSTLLIAGFLFPYGEGAGI